MKGVIESQRLVMRQISHEDFDIVAHMMRGENVQKVWGHYFSDEDVTAWIDRRLEGYGKWGVDYLLALDRESGRAVGQIGILREEMDGRPVWGIGYILLEEAEGMGYAREGAMAAAKYAFERLGAEAVYCDIRPENQGSLKVAQAMGMEEIGVYTKIYRGQQMPHLIFRKENPQRCGGQ